MCAAASDLGASWIYSWNSIQKTPNNTTRVVWSCWQRGAGWFNTVTLDNIFFYNTIIIKLKAHLRQKYQFTCTWEKQTRLQQSNIAQSCPLLFWILTKVLQYMTKHFFKNTRLRHLVLATKSIYYYQCH